MDNIKVTPPEAKSNKRQNNVTSNDSDAMKICPLCGEEIKAVAIKCRYCKSNLIDKSSPQKENIKDKLPESQVPNEIIEDLNINIVNNETILDEKNGNQNRKISLIIWIVTGFLLLLGLANHFLLEKKIDIYNPEYYWGAKISYVPFQESKGGKWGLIDKDGKELFSNLFDNQPSFVVNGIFYVKNEEGLYQYYTASSNPKKIGRPYFQVNYFIENVAPIVAPDEPIKFINRKGDEVFTFDKYKTNDVVWIDNFSCGFARFAVSGGKIGYINTSGVVVIEPIFQYANKFKEDIAVVSSEYGHYFTIDKKGRKLYDLKFDDKLYNGLIAYYAIDHRYESYDGVIPFGSCDYSVNYKYLGYFDSNGNIGKTVNNPNINTGYFTFNHDLNVVNKDNVWYFGVINKEGETVIQEDFIGGDETFIGENVVAFKNKEDKYGLIDFSGKIVCPYKFDKITSYIKSGVFVAYISDNCYFIDELGDRILSKNYSEIITPGYQYIGRKIWAQPKSGGSFFTFIIKFFRNKEFQLSNIKFPLPDIEGYEGSSSKPAPDKDSWRYLSSEYLFEDLKIIGDQLMTGRFDYDSPEKVSYGVGIPESDWMFYMTFEVIDGKWMLTDYQTY